MIHINYLLFIYFFDDFSQIKTYKIRDHAYINYKKLMNKCLKIYYQKF